MLRDTRLRFSNSRMPEDLAKQWDKEQKKLLSSALGPAPPLHIAEGYLGRASCSGCSKSPFVGAQRSFRWAMSTFAMLVLQREIGIIYQVWVS